jgi:hypothetical protein
MWLIFYEFCKFVIISAYLNLFKTGQGDVALSYWPITVHADQPRGPHDLTQIHGPDLTARLG